MWGSLQYSVVETLHNVADPTSCRRSVRLRMSYVVSKSLRPLFFFLFFFAHIGQGGGIPATCVPVFRTIVRRRFDSVVDSPHKLRVLLELLSRRGFTTNNLAVGAASQLLIAYFSRHGGQLMARRLADIGRANEASQISPSRSRGA